MEDGNGELRFLGNVVKKADEGYDWDRDDKRQRILLKESGLEDRNGDHTPMATR